MEFSKYLDAEMKDMGPQERVKFLKAIAAETQDLADRAEFHANHTGRSAEIMARIDKVMGGSGDVKEYQTKEEMICDRIDHIMSGGLERARAEQAKAAQGPNVAGFGGYVAARPGTHVLP